MQTVIEKLNNTNIKTPITYIIFNAYLIKSVYFGCGIIELSNKQDKILQSIHENTILVKLNLGWIFWRSILCTRKIAIGVGLIKLSTTIAMLVMKLCIGYYRAKTIIVKILNTQNKMLFIKNRLY